MSKLDELLSLNPYETIDREGFTQAMRESVRYHYANSKQFKKFLDSQSFDVKSDFKVEDIPYLPVALFKEVKLLTGDAGVIKKHVFSSSTTGKKPSVVCLDQVTIDRQRTVLAKIITNFIGERKPFVIFDSPSAVKVTDGEVSSRGSAILGMLPFAKKFYFILNDDLEIDAAKLEEAVEELKDEQEVCLFGFTWVMYQIMQKNNPLFKKFPKQKTLLHIGGWKKLKDLQIEKKDFNNLAAESFAMDTDKVIDMYGMTEQLGTVYPDCSEGYKHVPIYSDVIVRDVNDLSVCQSSQSGFLQFISFIPNSYPGISILSDDIGEIVGLDGCTCGRKGKYFIFKKRHEEAELKGCGDTI